MVNFVINQRLYQVILFLVMCILQTSGLLMGIWNLKKSALSLQLKPALSVSCVPTACRSSSYLYFPAYCAAKNYMRIWYLLLSHQQSKAHEFVCIELQKVNKFTAFGCSSFWTGSKRIFFLLRRIKSNLTVMMVVQAAKMSSCLPDLGIFWSR
mgnify:CR=1 FL=1